MPPKLEALDFQMSKHGQIDSSASPTRYFHVGSESKVRNMSQHIGQERKQSSVDLSEKYTEGRARNSNSLTNGRIVEPLHPG